MKNEKHTFYMWQNGMCITYTLRFRQMRDFLTANDWEAITDPAAADHLIIGACASFIPYMERYAEKITELQQLGKPLTIYGCLPAVDKGFYRRYTTMDAGYIHTKKPERIERLVSPLKVRWEDVPIPSEFRMEDYTNYQPGKHYIFIQEGCTEGCYFCPHMIAIGKETSRPISEVVHQVKASVSAGATCVVLEGNNCGSWGLDLEPLQRFPELLAEILDIPGRHSFHIGNFSPKWIEAYGACLNHPRITDIKIPLQSASSRLLKDLGRTPVVHELVPVLKELKKDNPDLVLRTEIIIGLPTETESDLLETLSFVREHFDKVACFSYDFHPRTRVALMDIPRHDEAMIARRVKTAMDFFGDDQRVVAVFNNRGSVCQRVNQTSDPMG